MDLDNVINCWYIDTPYLWIPGTTLHNCERRYFLHENCNVYYKKKQTELYIIFSNRYDHQFVSIYNPRGLDINFPHNLFKVMDPYNYNYEGEYRVNGKKINIPENISLYLYLWKTFGFKKIEYIYVNDVITKNIFHSKLNEDVYPQMFDKNIINSETKIFDNYNIKFNTSNIKRKDYIPPREYKKFIFYLNDDFPRRPYSSKIKSEYPTYHIGQLKLLMTEIFFLTEKLGSIDEYCVCVYIGSAGGFHIPILANMFPHILFILYDGAKHYINPSHNIVIHQELFLEHNVDMYKNMKVYFISDIRVPDNDYLKFERNVYTDNLLNRNIVMELKPKESLLKFRFPYEIDSIDEKIHHNGKFLLQMFAPVKSSETRLIPYNNEELIEGNNILYEEQMMYFNTMYRDRSFEDLDELFGLNYDFYSFYKTMEMFLKRKNVPKNKIKDKIIIFLKNLEEIKSIGKPKSLQHKSLLQILFGYNPKLTKKQN